MLVDYQAARSVGVGPIGRYRAIENGRSRCER